MLLAPKLIYIVLNLALARKLTNTAVTFKLITIPLAPKLIYVFAPKLINITFVCKLIFMVFISSHLLNITFNRLIPYIVQNNKKM